MAVIKKKVVTAEGIHARIGFELGCRLAEYIKNNNALRGQIDRSRGIEEAVLSGIDKALSVGVGVFAVSSLADKPRVLFDEGHRKAGCGKSAHPVLRDSESFFPYSAVHQLFILNYSERQGNFL